MYGTLALVYAVGILTMGDIKKALLSLLRTLCRYFKNCIRKRDTKQDEDGLMEITLDVSTDDEIKETINLGNISKDMTKVSPVPIKFSLATGTRDKSTDTEHLNALARTI